MAALIGPVAAGGALFPVAGGVFLQVGAEVVGHMALLRTAHGTLLPVVVGVGGIAVLPGVGGSLRGGAAADQAGADVLAVVLLLPGAPPVLPVGAVGGQGGWRGARNQEHGQQECRQPFLPEVFHLYPSHKIDSWLRLYDNIHIHLYHSGKMSVNHEQTVNRGRATSDPRDFPYQANGLCDGWPLQTRGNHAVGLLWGPAFFPLKTFSLPGSTV